MLLNFESFFSIVPIKYSSFFITIVSVLLIESYIDKFGYTRETINMVENDNQKRFQFSEEFLIKTEKIEFGYHEI